MERPNKRIACTINPTNWLDLNTLSRLGFNVKKIVSTLKLRFDHGIKDRVNYTIHFEMDWNSETDEIIFTCYLKDYKKEILKQSSLVIVDQIKFTNAYEVMLIHNAKTIGTDDYIEMEAAEFMLPYYRQLLTDIGYDMEEV